MNPESRRIGTTATRGKMRVLPQRTDYFFDGLGRLLGELTAGATEPYWVRA